MRYDPEDEVAAWTTAIEVLDGLIVIGFAGGGASVCGGETFAVVVAFAFALALALLFLFAPLLARVVVAAVLVAIVIDELLVMPIAGAGFEGPPVFGAPGVMLL